MSTFPAPVPKPANPGTGQLALTKTTAAYVNLRSGPGTTYRDIGDIRNNTIIIYYPLTKNTEGWLWLEQGSVGGWVSTSVIGFQNISATPPAPSQQATPYDGKVAVWHWKGDSLAENDIETALRNLKEIAPQVNAIFVKTSDATPRDGARWQGFWDTKRSLAIDSPASIDKWVQACARYNIDFHAWCVPKGTHPDQETDLIIQVCNRPGVKSMILDVEPYDGFWQGGKAGIRPFMTAIRRKVPGSFHIGMTIDPRKQHYDSVYPLEWFPFVNSIHPQSYWSTFRKSPEETLSETYAVWGSFGKPIVPAFGGDADPLEIQQAIVLSTQVYKARGLSWWRLGVIEPAAWKAISQPINVTPTPTPTPTPPPGTNEIIVKPGDPNFTKGTYTGQPEFEESLNTWGWKYLHKATQAQTSKVWVRWTPTLRDSGRYEISAFIPGRNANTGNARFKINNVKGSNGEIVVNTDQSRLSNQWVTLGIFDLDKTSLGAGTVFLNDLTGEADKEIAFDAIRWRQIIGGAQYVADGYDAPMASDAERRTTKIWPGSWYDVSPFGKLYFVGTPSEAYHTGADLNLPGDGDRHTGVYACASGVVTFASSLPVWGNVLVIKHDPLVGSNKVLYSRCGHVEDILVKVGDRVKRGQQIASVGNAFGRFAYHLHFDLSPTSILESQPGHWPAQNATALFGNYIDPAEFIKNNRPK